MNNEIDLGVVLVLIGIFLLFRKIWQTIQKRRKAFVKIKTKRIPIGLDRHTGFWVYRDLNERPKEGEEKC